MQNSIVRRYGARGRRGTSTSSEKDSAGKVQLHPLTWLAWTSTSAGKKRTAARPVLGRTACVLHPLPVDFPLLPSKLPFCHAHTPADPTAALLRQSSVESFSRRPAHSPGCRLAPPLHLFRTPLRFRLPTQRRTRSKRTSRVSNTHRSTSAAFAYAFLSHKLSNVRYSSRIYTISYVSYTNRRSGCG